MPEGLIDTATLAQVVQCFDRGMTELYPWSQQVVVDLTALLIREDTMALAPGLAPHRRAARDDQELLMDIMLRKGLVTRLSHHSKDASAKAIEKSLKWIQRRQNIVAVRNETDHLLTDESNFLRWIDWVVDKAWLPHTARFDGLFDKRYLRYVAKVLDISEIEANDLHRRSKDSAELGRLARQRGEDFEYMTRAFIASAIMRGRYHREIARERDIHIIPHPFRRIVSKTRKASDSTYIEVPLVVSYLAALVLCGAMRQSNTRNRLECWVANTANVRRYLAQAAFAPREFAPSPVALADAWKTAVAANVQVIDSRMLRDLDVLLKIGVGVLSIILITPWRIAIPAAVLTAIGPERLDVPHHVNRLALFMRQRHLKESAAGWIESKWTGERELGK